MISTAPIRFVKGASEPFSERHPGVVLGTLNESFGYAFNLESPSGIKVLSLPLLERLKQKLFERQEQSDLNSLDVELLKHGLISAQNYKAGAVEQDVFKNADTASNRKPKSLNLWIHLVNGCNLSCFYCYIPSLSQKVDETEINNHSFAQDTVRPLLNKIFRYCADHEIETLGLKFAGGEPTLNLNLLEFFCSSALELCGNTKLQFGLISNGTCKAPHFFKILRDYRFSVSFSVDGLEHKHNAIRYVSNQKGSREGTWKNIWSSIIECQDMGLKPYVLYTLTPNNADDLNEFANTCADRAIGYRLGLVRISTPPKPEAIEKLATALIGLYRTLGERQPCDLPITKYAKFAEWSLDKKKILSCSTGRSYFAINHKAELATCQMAMNNVYGNAATEDFDEILQRINKDGKANVLTQPWLRGGACARCEFKYVCAGGCPQHTKSQYGSFGFPSPWCRVYGALLPVYVESVAKQMLRRYEHETMTTPDFQVA